MDVSSYYSGLLNQTAVTPYSQDFVGGVQLIEKSGFLPFKEKEPLNSTLNQIFEEFKQKTGFDVDVNELKNEFLDNNPQTRNAMNLYNSLENTFSSKLNEPSAIENFLNDKIDEYISDYDTDNDNELNTEEIDITDTKFKEIDKEKNGKINSDEIKNNFYEKFNSLKNILNYFKTNPGTLLDTYA